MAIIAVLHCERPNNKHIRNKLWQATVGSCLLQHLKKSCYKSCICDVDRKITIFSPKGKFEVGKMFGIISRVP